MEPFLPITLPTAARPLSSTGHMRHGLRERTGGLNCRRENKFAVSLLWNYTQFDSPTDYSSALALSDSYIVAVTSKDYVRVYTLFGTPFKVYRQKSRAVTCAAWRDYIMSIGNGPIGADGIHTTLRYTLENVKRDEICQNEDTVALPEGALLQNVFFSDNGVHAKPLQLSMSEADHVLRILTSTIRPACY